MPDHLKVFSDYTALQAPCATVRKYCTLLSLWPSSVYPALTIIVFPGYSPSPCSPSSLPLLGLPARETCAVDRFDEGEQSIFLPVHAREVFVNCLSLHP
ncbi:hypothetical protein BaRGS_00008994 [Batillaria attramentaria]|uniref:Uncharacterized protein n=1 Tax=Batillaria attramentaria TaxID=370345 RepID=A0ABD0LKM4_9CAEN